MSFLNAEQESLAEQIAGVLFARGETVTVAESTTGGLVSAALLSVAGASRYFAGGGVVYTLKSRTVLGGVSAEQYANYRGTTPEMLASLAESMRERLGATWCVAESGLAGPTGGRSAAAGHTTVCIVGPAQKSQVLDTGSDDRAGNMVTFATYALTVFLEALRSAGPA